MKPFWKSKTFWLNVIAAALLIYQGVTGHELALSPEQQALLLAIINLALRAVTREPISWS